MSLQSDADAGGGYIAITFVSSISIVLSCIGQSDVSDVDQSLHSMTMHPIIVYLRVSMVVLWSQGVMVLGASAAEGGRRRPGACGCFCSSMEGDLMMYLS